METVDPFGVHHAEPTMPNPVRRNNQLLFGQGSQRQSTRYCGSSTDEAFKGHIMRMDPPDDILAHSIQCYSCLVRSVIQEVGACREVGNIWRRMRCAKRLEVHGEVGFVR